MDRVFTTGENRVGSTRREHRTMRSAVVSFDSCEMSFRRPKSYWNFDTSPLIPRLTCSYDPPPYGAARHKSGQMIWAGKKGKSRRRVRVAFHTTIKS